MSNQILNVYLRGSHVYKTNDEESDVDYLFVVDYHAEKESLVFGSQLVHPAEYFQSMLDRHSTSALECFFLPERLKIETQKFNFILDLAKLRRSFSQKASNSWVKAKKKINIHSEYRKGRKSLFHSLRLLTFGTQIARNGRIINYQGANNYWHIIQQQGYEQWEQYKEYWQPIYNNLKSEFKKVAPL